MKKILLFLLAAMPIVVAAQSKQHLISYSLYEYLNNSIEKTDSTSYLYGSQKPAYLNERQGWNSDTSYAYDNMGNIKGLKRNLYDANGRISEATEYSLTSTGTWTPGLRNTYTYDAAGNILTLEHERFLSGQYEKYTRMTYTYNSSNQLLSRLSESWNTSTMQYMGDLHTTRTYSGGKLIEQLQEIYTSGSWSLSDRNTYTYPTPTTSEDLYETYAGGVWTPTFKTDHTMDASQRVLSSLSTSYNGSNWENSEQQLYTYYASGSIMSKEVKAWSAGAWEGRTIEEYTYNGDDNKLTETRKIWDGTGYIFKNGCWSFFYHYGFPTSVDNTPAAADGIEVYPVPAGNSITVRMQHASSQHYKGSVYDAAGRLAKTFSGTATGGAYTTTVDVADLPAGNYVLHLQTGGMATSRKVVIAR